MNLKSLAAAIAAAAVTMVAGAAYATTVPVSAGCIAGPGSPTCFRPSLHIGSDPTGNLIPLFVEVSLPGAHADLAGAEAVISMQANLVGSEFISKVLMNLDPLVNPADITIALHAQSGVSNTITVTDGTNNQGGEGFFGFDINFDIDNSPPAGRFSGTDLVTFRVDCAGASCVNFNVNSFNFTELSDQGNSAQGDFRICVRVQGVGTSGSGSDKVCGVASEGQVPEPGTLMVLGLGLVGSGFAGRRLRRK